MSLVHQKTADLGLQCFTKRIYKFEKLFTQYMGETFQDYS